MATLSEFLNSINKKKGDLTNDPDGYIPFIVNRLLSYHTDAVLHAQCINEFPDIPKKLQYVYYYRSVRERSRYAKLADKHKTPNIELIKKHYNCNSQKALEILDVLTTDQINTLIEIYDTTNLDQPTKEK